MDKVLTKAIEHWVYIAPVVRRPKNKKDFDRLSSQLGELLEMVEEDENHCLMGLVDILSNYISEYEAERYQNDIGKGIDALKFLMESHQLDQADFPEIASKDVMSEILNGKRSLNLRQIKLLSKRFNVDPSTFID